MPRCQRTLRTLPGSMGGSCPFCADGETYTLIADGDLLDYQQIAFAALTRDFGTPADARVSVRLWRGLMPECVRSGGGRGYDLYLSAGSDALQLRGQIGHEMFHRVCSQGRIFHWTHEALACVFSVRLLRQCGFCAYADAMDAAYRAQAERLSTKALLAADAALPPYPPGLYGRAYVTGDALVEAVGWPTVCALTALDRSGRAVSPDIPRWLQTFAPAAALAELIPARVV